MNNSPLVSKIQKAGQAFKNVLSWKNFRRLVKWTGLGFAAVFILFLLFNWFFPLPDKIEYSVIITDNKGEVINSYLTRDQKWRMKTELEEISPLLQKTIIAKEDRYFYSHPGVNPLAVGRAFFQKRFPHETHIRCEHHYHAGSKGTRTAQENHLEQVHRNVPRLSTGMEIR